MLGVGSVRGFYRRVVQDNPCNGPVHCIFGFGAEIEIGLEGQSAACFLVVCGSLIEADRRECVRPKAKGYSSYMG